MAYIAVAGGANVDVGAHALQKLRPKDSNPGHVHTSFGGVGRNIAHNLRLLGVDVELFSALGTDDYGAAMEKDCAAIGLCLAGIFPLLYGSLEGLENG